MDSNYEWQKRRADERVQARMQEAQFQRTLSVDSTQRPFFLFRAWQWLLTIVTPGQRRRHEVEPRVSHRIKRA